MSGGAEPEGECDSHLDRAQEHPDGELDDLKLSPDEKKLFARQMEVYAAFGKYADYEIGRLIDTIKKARTSSTRP